MKILISGASGYLGSQLVKSLSKCHEVVALVRSSSSKVRLQNLPIEIAYLDEEGALEKVFKMHKPEVVINTAALYGRKGESMSALLEANIDFPIKLLAMANQFNSKAFINTGTSLPDNVSPYALTKNTFVKLAEFNKGKELKFINVALEHFYGGGDDENKFITFVINQCIANEELKLTAGTQLRDFIYIDDVLSAYDAILINLNQIQGFETIPVGSGEVKTVRSIVEVIHKETKSLSELEFGAVAIRDNEVLLSCADVLRIRQLGWECQNDFITGLRKVLVKL